MPRQEGLWLDDHTAFMRECLLDGMSAKQCAGALNERFGTAYSRNAVCGRAARARTTYAKPKRQPVPRKERVITVRPKPKPQPKPLVVDEATGFRCADVEPMHLSLLELGADQCHWPYGDEAFTFCGHPIVTGSYCLDHAALASVPAERRRAA